MRKEMAEFLEFCRMVEVSDYSIGWFTGYATARPDVTVADLKAAYGWTPLTDDERTALRAAAGRG